MNELQATETEIVGQRTLFDYAALDAETRIVVQQRAGEIKGIAKRMAADVVEIGEKLADVKQRLGANGCFNDWLSAELGWSPRTAHNFIGVWRRFGSANFAIENVAVSALYALAAPSTPTEAIDEVKQIADSGQEVTHTVVKEIIEKAKAKQPKQAELVEAVDPSAICLCGCRAGAHTRVRGQYGECCECDCEIFQQATEEEIAERNAAEKALGITPSKSPVPQAGATPTAETITRLKAEMGLEEEEAEKASDEPSTEFFARPTGWFNSPIEIRITLLPGGDAETRKIQYAVRDAAIQFRAAPLTAEDHGEDTLLRLLPDAAYNLVEQLAAEWGKNQWSDASKKRLKAEAIARWRREPVETVKLDEEQEDYQAEWLKSLSYEERERYDGARCSCGCCREWHDGAGGCCMGCLRGECDQFHCATCDTKGGHKASCKYYVAGERRPIPSDPPYQKALAPIELPQEEINRIADFCNSGRLGEKRPLKPLAYVDGRPYLVTGVMGAGDAKNWSKVWAWPVYPPYSLTAKQTNQRTYEEAKAEYYKRLEEDDDFHGPIDYNGVKINVGTKKKPDEWVMVGPEVTFLTGGADEEGDPHAKFECFHEWLAGLSEEEREQYESAPCHCGHARDFHEEDDRIGEYTGECTALNCGKTSPVERCTGYHCATCDTKGGHQASCKHYVLGEGTPAQNKETQTNSENLALIELPQAEINRMSEYSASGQIPDEQPVKICHILDQPHVITGAVWEGEDCLTVFAMPILPLGDFSEEKAKTYSQALAARHRSGISEALSYEGIKINCGSKKKPVWWVMVGPNKTFTVDYAASYPNDEIEADPEEVDLPQAEEPTIEAALYRALHCIEDAEKRWERLRQNGATDAELTAALAYEWDGEPGGSVFGGYRCKGKKNPEFSWPGMVKKPSSTTLKGKRLLAKAREVLGIGAPGVKEIKVPFPKAAGKTAVTINLIQDFNDGMWRSSYHVRAGAGATSSLPSIRSQPYQSRENAIKSAAELARLWLLKEVESGSLSENSRRQALVALPALDKWIIANTAAPSDPQEESSDPKELPPGWEWTKTNARTWPAYRAKHAELPVTTPIFETRGGVRDWIESQGARVVCEMAAEDVGRQAGRFPHIGDPSEFRQGLVTIARAEVDDFTAPRCAECGRIDGAHSDTCSQRPNALTFEDYLSYARFTWGKQAESQARKWQLTREKDGEVTAWKLYWEELKGKGVNPSSDLCLCAHPKAKHDKHVGCLTLLDSGQSCECVAFVASTKAEEQKRAKKGRAGCDRGE